MTDDALDIVMKLPPEEWGLGYEVMTKCLPYFKPERGNLENYFARAMRRKRIDEHRRIQVRPLYLQPPADWDFPDPARHVERLDIPAISEDDWHLHLLGRGLTYEAIAADQGIPVGTVKSRVHASRERLRAQFAE